MNLKIFFLICIFVGIKAMETLRRIKRNTDSKAHDNRVKQDFVMLQDEKAEAIAAIKSNSLKALNSNNKQNNSLYLTPVSDHIQNISTPLATILRKKQHKLNKKRLQDRHVPELATLSEDSKNKSEHFMDSHCGLKDKSRESFKYHKTKHLPHLFHSRSKVDLRPQHMQPFLKGFSSFTSMEQLMKLGNMMMIKIGMDSVPYAIHRSKTHMKENSPDIFETENINQPSSEPLLDYIFNSIEGPQGNYYQPKTINVNEDNALLAVSIKQPIPVSKVMQTALDALLQDVDGGDGSEHEIDVNCPIHHIKKSAQNNNDEDADADVIQVCSCRLKKGHKKFK